MTGFFCFTPSISISAIYRFVLQRMKEVKKQRVAIQAMIEATHAVE